MIQKPRHVVPFFAVLLVGLAACGKLPRAVGNDSIDRVPQPANFLNPKVELVAVCESPQQDHGWWDITGKPLDEAPQLAAAKPAKKPPADMKRDEISRLIVLKARVAPTATVGCKIPGHKWSLRLPEQADGRDWKELKEAAKKRGEPFRAEDFRWIEYSIGVQVVCPKEQTAATARISIADGPWETVAVRPRRPGDGQTLQFDLGRLGKNGVKALLPQTAEKEVRVLAEDKQGELHPSATNFVVAGEFGTALKMHTRFKLAAAEIEAYHLQARPYEWLQLPGISLYPLNISAAQQVRLSGGSFRGDRSLLGDRKPSDAPQDLDWMNPTNQQLVLIHDLPSLRRLKVAGEAVTDKAAEIVAAAQGLQHVGLHSPRLTAECLQHLADSRASIMEIMGEGLVSVPARFLHSISTAPNLTQLKLWDTELTDEGAEAISAARKLEVLHARGDRLTDAGLRSLAKLSELRELHLGDTDCTDEGFASLAKFKRLRVLDLQGDKVSDEGLRHLATLLELRSLNLSGMNLTDDCWKHLAKLPDLEKLDLRGTGCTRAGWNSVGEARPPRSYLPHPPGRNVKVRVTVLDAAEEPAADANVYLLTTENISTRSNSIGKPSRSLPELDRGETDENGNVVLRFHTDQAEGWLMLWAISPRGEPAVMTLRTPRGQSSVSRKLSFRPGELNYRLLDAAGRPVAGVRVFPLRVDRDVPGSFVDSPLTRTTDRNGRVVLRGLTAEDTTRLAFFSREFGNQSTPWQSNGLPDGSTIQLSQTGSLRGVVRSDEPAALNKLKGTVYTNVRQEKHPDADFVTRHSWADLQIDEEGRFQVEHLSPDWTFFSDETESDHVRLNWQPMEIETGETTDVRLQAIRPVHLRGSIRLLHDWDPAAKFPLRVRSGYRTGDWAWSQNVTTDESGRFSAYVMPGQVDLYINRFYEGKYRSIDHWLWRGDRFGGYWNVTNDFPVRHVEPIDLVRSVEEKGKLLDREGNPIADAMVYGFPAPLDAEVTNCVGGHTGDDGTFEMLYPATHPPVAFRGHDRDGEYVIKQKEPLRLVDETKP